MKKRPDIELVRLIEYHASQGHTEKTAIKLITEKGYNKEKVKHYWNSIFGR